MRFIANNINGSYLREILPSPNTEVDGVLAAIAYGSYPNNLEASLIGNCLNNNIRLDIWMRYDHRIRVKDENISLLEANGFYPIERSFLSGLKRKLILVYKLKVFFKKR